MGLDKNSRDRDRNDPARRRLSGDQFVERDERIWAMRADGHTIQAIADTVGCGLATVDRALKRLAKRMARLDGELAGDVDAALARYDGESLHCEDVRTAEDVLRLNDLELYRLSHLPLSHPARAAVREAAAAGWEWPVPPEPAGCCDWRDIDADW